MSYILRLTGVCQQQNSLISILMWIFNAAWDKKNHVPKTAERFMSWWESSLKPQPPPTFFKQRQTATPKRNKGHKLKSPTEKWLKYTEKRRWTHSSVSHDRISWSDTTSRTTSMRQSEFIASFSLWWRRDGRPTVSQVSLHFLARRRERETI